MREALRLSLTTKASIFASVILLALIAARAIYSLVTGYILPDEAFYYNLFLMHGGLGFSTYRPVLHLFYILFFSGTSSIPQLFVRGALFCSLWAVGSIFVLGKVLKALEIPDKPSALVILSFVLMPVFPLMAVFFVTETMALFFGLTGMYFSIRYVKHGGWKPASLAALMFLFASQVREPYMLFLVATPFALLLLRRPTVKAALGYGSVALIGLPIPTSVHPLSISQPVSNVLFEWLPNLFLHSAAHASTSSLSASIFTTSVSGIGLTVAYPEFYAFGLGLLFGIGPLMAVLLFASPMFVRNRIGILVAFFSALGLIAFFVVTNFAVEFLPDASFFWLSDIIRLSSAALPAGVALGYLYSKAGPKFAYVVLVGTLVIGGAMLPALASAIQSSQNIQSPTDPVNRLSLAYRAPYLRMAETAIPGSLIVAGVGSPQLSVFTSFDRNVTISGIPANISEFRALVSEGWTKVYLYDSWVNLNATFFAQCGCYPTYYQNIVLGHNVTVIWSDSESYAEVLS